jgi:hypothetical protein
MGIYIAIYTFFFLCSFLDIKPISLEKKKYIIYFWVVVFTLFRGLRWDCGTDWDQFYLTFLEADWNNIFSFDRGYGELLEPGYVFFNVLIKFIGGNYTTYLLASNFFVMFAYAQFSLKYSRYPIMSLITIMSLGLIFPVRQTLAAAIILFGYQYIVNRDFLKFSITVLIAALIHTSSVVVVPLYFVYNRIQLKIWSIIAVFIGSLVLGNYMSQIMLVILNLFSFLGEIFTYRLEIYVNVVTHTMGSDFRNKSYSHLIVGFIFVVFFYINKKNNKINYSNYNSWLNMYILAIAISNLFFTYMRDLDRIREYFILISAPLLAYLVGQSGEKNKYLRCVFYVFFILFMYTRLFSSLFGVYKHLLIPYKSIFS